MGPVRRPGPRREIRDSGGIEISMLSSFIAKKFRTIKNHKTAKQYYSETRVKYDFVKGCEVSFAYGRPARARVTVVNQISLHKTSQMELFSFVPVRGATRFWWFKPQSLIAGAPATGFTAAENAARLQPLLEAFLVA